MSQNATLDYAQAGSAYAPPTQEHQAPKVEEYLAPDLEVMAENTQSNSSTTEQEYSSENISDLINDISFRLNMAHSNFGDACQNVKHAVHKAAEAQKEFTCMLIDIALGYLIPSAGKAFANLANNIPTNSPMYVYRGAISMLDADRNMQNLTSISKVGISAFKSKFESYLVGTETDTFINSVKIASDIAFDNVNQGINRSTPVDKLLSFYYMFAPEYTHTHIYESIISDLVSKFQNDVELINTQPLYAEISSSLSSFYKVAYIGEGSDKKLAIVEKTTNYNLAPVDRIFNTSYSQGYIFHHWISPEMEELAVQKAGGFSNIISLDSSDISIP
ncbi:hypothetical protein [Persicobacter diffluens]|uniref:Uncharacterized protein n=1 Tax=Persicobacter diffluens TaxID=981 RepID=A0AAN5AMD0_9BACT|nr:hypothetical protein PEDI_54820 [Persicobacter diffluens]